MSEYLTRLKQLRDAKPSDSFVPPNVHSNVSFRKAIDYIEQLESNEVYLLNRVKHADKELIEKTVFIDSQNIAINDLKRQVEQYRHESEYE